jgi:hypothetical protein
MPITQISKMQLRRGLASDLPGAPVTLSPLAFAAGLDDGEMGFTTDQGRLFIGQNSPTNGSPNYQRTAYPYQNIEVLTENSALYLIMAPITADNQYGFTQAVPMINTNVPTTLQVLDINKTAQDFHVELSNGAAAVFQYFIYDNTNAPIRIGRLTVLWNSNMVGNPLLVDDSTVSDGSLENITWSAALTGSIADQHIVLQYTNVTGNTATCYFRGDRPTF